jgi:hypothetical protein
VWQVAAKENQLEKVQDELQQVRAGGGCGWWQRGGIARVAWGADGKTACASQTQEPQQWRGRQSFGPIIVGVGVGWTTTCVQAAAEAAPGFAQQ